LSTTRRDDYLPPRYTIGDGALDLSRRELLWNRHCRHTIVVEKAVGINVDAETHYGPPASYRGVVLHRFEKFRDTNGDELISTTQVGFAFPAPDVTPDDRVTLPNGDQPRILSTNRDLIPSIHALILYT